MQNTAENITAFPEARQPATERATIEQLSSVTDLEHGTDTDRAARLSKAIAAVQEAMDGAILAGLTVEPTFKKLANRFTSQGVCSDSYMINVHAFRKLI